MLRTASHKYVILNKVIFKSFQKLLGILGLNPSQNTFNFFLENISTDLIGFFGLFGLGLSLGFETGSHYLALDCLEFTMYASNL